MKFHMNSWCIRFFYKILNIYVNSVCKCAFTKHKIEFDGQSKIRYNVLSFWPVHHPPLHSPFLYTHSIFTSCADKPIPLVVLACRPHLHSQNLRDKCDRQRQICVLYAYVCMCVCECGERTAGWFWEGNIGSRK